MSAEFATEARPYKDCSTAPKSQLTTTVVFDKDELYNLVDFIEIEFARIGADTHITPREVIRDFIEVLDIIYQNPGMKVRTLLGSDSFSYAQNTVNEETTHAEFAEFEI